MLTSVIIILRESLEASLLISLLAVLHLKFNFYRHWIIGAIFFSLISAFLYAKFLGTISTWFNGSGQEVFSGFELFIISLCLIYHNSYINYLFSRTHVLSKKQREKKYLLPLTISAIIIIVISITREGSEAFIYYIGINSHPEKISSMIIGGVIGGGLGLCIGILIFVSLYQLTNKNIIVVTSIIFILISSGLMLEATKSFIQAGWLIPSEALWDTSKFISESSIIGQLLYAAFFYEATPTPQEITVWSTSIVCQVILLFGIYYFYPRDKKG